MSASKSVIDSFRGDFRWLSNFHYGEFIYDGVKYITSEHAYQAAKTFDLIEKQRIIDCDTPRKAKNLGMKVTLRPDWEQVKLQIMNNILIEKFKDKNLQDLLLMTGSAKLIEGNDWNDTFWGVCRGKGENHLGRILMKIRHNLQL